MYLSGDKTIKQIAEHFGVHAITVNGWSAKQGWSTKRQMIHDEVESQVAVRAAADILTAKETAQNARLLALQELQRRLQESAPLFSVRDLTTTVSTLTAMVNGEKVGNDEIWELVSECPQPATRQN